MIPKKYLISKPSGVKQFRDAWLKKGYELVNITTLCEARIGNSGWINNINEPNETCHHIQILYRDEIVANGNSDRIYVIDDDKYVLFEEKDRNGNDFIIFKKCLIVNEMKGGKRKKKW